MTTVAGGTDGAASGARHPLRGLARGPSGGCAVPARGWINAALTANALHPPSNYWLGAGSMIAGAPVDGLAPFLLGATAADGLVGLARGRGAAAAVSMVTAAGQVMLIRRARATGAAVDAALDAAIGREVPAPDGAHTALRRTSAVTYCPFPVRPTGVEVIRNVPYLDDGVDSAVPVSSVPVSSVPVSAGPDSAGRDPVGRDADASGRARRMCRLDIHRSRSAGTGAPAPILLHVHGGMWMGSDKRYEALPLIHAMAERGWVCVSINYRLCPEDPWPAPIVDVKRAIAWIRAHAADYGADPSFIAVTGGSAGGHLAALAALTPDEPRLQTGLPAGADTSVQAAVPQYGIYDFTAHSGTDRAVQRRDRFLAPMILRKDPVADADDFALASPLLHAHADAPPFFVLHGTGDTGVEIEESRHFVRHLRGVSRSPVAFAELPGAQHAYDHLPSIRTRHTVPGIARFLEWARSTRP